MIQRLLASLFCGLFFCNTLHAQMPTSVYTDPIIGYYTGVDTQYQYFDEVKTPAQENILLNRLFPFPASDFKNSYQNLSTIGDLQFFPNLDFTHTISWASDSGFYHAGKIQFVMHQDTSDAFFYKLHADADSNTAFLIIPGSGWNQATSVSLYYPPNYHNSVCAIAKKCQAYGDVFTFVRPNEDFVSIWTSISTSNRRKMNYNYLNATSNLMNQNWAANCFIQMNAITKYLKGKYKKVVVLGLSSGSWGAYFTSLQSEPDAAQIASGYSVLFNDLSYGAGPDQLHFDGLFSSNPADSGRVIIKNQATQYLFSYGAADAVTHMDTENANHITQNYFNTPDTLSNASYFYDFTTHRFPCEALDTFFTRIKKMPKALMQISNACVSDSAILKINFIGNAPFTFQLMRNDTLIGNFTSVNDSMFITLTQEGNYGLLNLMDTNQTLGFKVNPLNYIKHPKLEVNSISENFVCNTDTTLLSIAYSGTSPFTLYYAVNGATIDSLITSSTSHTFHLTNGNYNLYKLKDANSCEVVLNESFNFNYHKLNDSLSLPIYLCDSNITKLNLQLWGNSPWNIQYMKNGLVQSSQIIDTLTSHYFNNGIYFFINVSDSTGCVKSMNNYYVLSYDSLIVTTSSPQYNCDSNKLALPFLISGNPPYVLNYDQDGISMQKIFQGSEIMYLENGNYNFNNITDTTGCVFQLNFFLPVNYDTLSLQMSAPVFSCDSNKTHIQFQFQGNPPYTIFYLQDGISKSLSTSNSIYDAYFENGNYYFNSISDYTLCNATINTNYNFQFQNFNASIVQQSYNCDSLKYEIVFSLSGNAPWVLEYSDGVNVFTKTIYSTNYHLFLPNGNYILQKISDATGCENVFNQGFNISYDMMNASLISQTYDCDSNALKLSFSLSGDAPWNIGYIENGISPVYHNFITNNPNANLFLDSTSYLLTEINDANNCSVIFNQVINNNYQALSIIDSTQVYDCDSSKAKISFQVSGNAPWVLAYKNNASSIIYVDTFINSNFSFYLASGDYTLLELQDATCSLVLNDTLNLNFQVLQSVILPETLYCDLGKYVVKWIHTGGVKPYTLHYLANGNNVSLTTNKDTSVFYLANGLYFFGDITDSIGCTIQHSNMISISYNPFEYKGVSTKFLCEKDSTAISFDIQHQQPVWLTYTKDGGLLDTLLLNPDTTLIGSNGDYHWVSIYDGLGCADTINLHTIVNNQLPSVDSIFLEKNCDERTYVYHLQMQGATPFVLHYNLNNINKELALSGSLAQWKAETGAYYLVKIEDGNGCESNIGRADTLIPFLASDPVLSISNHHINTPSPAQQYDWYKNNKLMSAAGHSRQSEGDGQYYVIVHDKAGCMYKSNEVSDTYPSLINLYPNPVHDYTTLLINEDYGGNWNYVIMDIAGRKVGSGSETKPYKYFDLRYLSSGVYRIVCTFENDNVRQILQFVKD